MASDFPGGTVLDWTGTPTQIPKKPEANSQAEVGRIVDRWASTIIRDVQPETLARVARNTAPLQDHMSLCDKIYLDAHFLAVAEEYVGSIAGLEWDVMPYVDSPGAAAKEEDKKVAASIGEKLYNTPGIDQYFEHLTWGDGLYPLAGAETIWDINTYLPARFELADAIRWNWANDNTLRLLTVANPREGERLNPANWTIHSRAPQNPRKNRKHKALAFFYMVARMSTVDLLGVSEKFGKPIPIAYFENGDDKDAVVEAVMQIGTEFVGVFPKSVKVELLQALDAKSTLQQGLAQWAYDQATKLVCGHVLIVEAKGDTGALAGGGAQKTNIKKMRAGAGRVAGSARQGVMRPLAYFHHGEKALARVPYLVFKVKPAEDEEKKARTYVAWNDALAPLGLAIGQEHIKEAAGVPELVVRPTAGAAPSGELIAQQRETMKDLAAGLIVPEVALMALKRANVPEEEAAAAVEATVKAVEEIRKRQADTSPTKKPATPPAPATETAAQRATRKASQAASTPKVRTLTDVILASTLLGARGEQERSGSIAAAARQAADDGKTVREFLDELWEGFDTTDTTRDAELLGQGMAAAETIGFADAAVRAEGGE
jgi:phage gp29-like protein